MPHIAGIWEWKIQKGESMRDNLKKCGESKVWPKRRQEKEQIDLIYKTKD